MKDFSKELNNNAVLGNTVKSTNSGSLQIFTKFKKYYEIKLAYKFL